MYLMQGNKFELPISLHLFKGMVEEKALIDSGAMENFIDHATIKQLKLGLKCMDTPVPIQNIDGTTNQAGKITCYLDLIMS
jgi:hypothetical protein